MDANCSTKCARLQVDNKVGSGRVLRSAHYLQHKQMTDVPVTSVGGDHCDRDHVPMWPVSPVLSQYTLFSLHTSTCLFCPRQNISIDFYYFLQTFK